MLILLFLYKNSNTLLYIDRMKDNKEDVGNVSTVSASATAAAEKKL